MSRPINHREVAAELMIEAARDISVDAILTKLEGLGVDFDNSDVDAVSWLAENADIDITLRGGDSR
ncbi:hypothetical protein AB0N38_26420 [Micromonospora aurantiaca]|uniref:hypothetical protein n=1 Tax=Micromonospora aurantiaca (nom. illeg.) TaxID=47850 RepID=UPI0034337A3B